MTIEQLQKELTTAMKEKNKFKKEVIASLLSTAKNMAIEKGCKDNITEDIVTAAILKEKKSTAEMIDSCPTNRIDKLKEYTNRMEIINFYAPKMMTGDEIRVKALEIIKSKGIELAKQNKGQIMKEVIPFFKGKADGKLVNQIITKILV